MHSLAGSSCHSPGEGRVHALDVHRSRAVAVTQRERGGSMHSLAGSSCHSPGEGRVHALDVHRSRAVAVTHRERGGSMHSMCIARGQ